MVGKDGPAVEWLSLTGSTDLPTFVEDFSGTPFKGGLPFEKEAWTPTSSVSYRQSGGGIL
jgi:hypothetical protein